MYPFFWNSRGFGIGAYPCHRVEELLFHLSAFTLQSFVIRTCNSTKITEVPSLRIHSLNEMTRDLICCTSARARRTSLICSSLYSLLTRRAKELICTFSSVKISTHSAMLMVLTFTSDTCNDTNNSWRMAVEKTAPHLPICLWIHQRASLRDAARNR